MWSSSFPFLSSFEAVSSVQSLNKICILDIDIQGVQNINQSSLNPYCVFISPPSLAVLESRLRGRDTESEEEIAVRLSQAKEEIAFGKVVGNVDLFLVNDDLLQTFKALVRTLLQWYPDLLEENDTKDFERTYCETYCVIL